MAHAWTQLSGPTVTLDNPTHGEPSFTVPDDAADGTTLEFQLTVTDKEGESDSDTMVVTVAAPELVRPTACAGPDLAGAPGERVTLQGTCSANPLRQVAPDGPPVDAALRPAGDADASEDFPAGQQIRRPQLHHPRRCGGRRDGWSSN